MDVKAMLVRQRELLDAAEKEQRDLTEEEQREFDELTESIRAAAEADKDTDNGESADGAGSAEFGGGSRQAPGDEQRALQIIDLCEGTSLNARDLIASGASVSRVRYLVNEAMCRDHAPVPQAPPSSGVAAGSGVTEDAADKFREAASDAVCMRAGIALESPADGARELMGLSLRDVAIRCLASEGAGSIRDLMAAPSHDLFAMALRSYQPRIGGRAFMQPSGQFPVFLDQSIEKALVDFYKHPDYQFERICKIGTLPDFKPHDDNYMSGPVGDFEELPEGGEMKEDTFEFIKLGQRRLKTYAKRFSMSYQAFVNDDIGLLAEQPRKYARAWRRTLNNMVFSLLVGNAVLGDGAKFFSGPHKNLLASGTTVDTASITSMRYALRQQTDDFGERIMIRPASLIVPVGLDYDIATLFMSPTIETKDNTKAVNPLYGLGLEIIEDESINNMADKLGLETVPWFMAGASEDAPGIEIDYLNGESELQKRMGQPMDQLGFVWNFWGFAGVTAMDYRRYVMNPGIKIEPQIPVEQ